MCQSHIWQEALSFASAHAGDVALHGALLGAVLWTKALLCLGAKRGLRMNSATYTSAIKSTSRRAQWKESLTLQMKLASEGMQDSLAALASSLSARPMQWMYASKLLDTARDNQAEMDASLQNKAVFSTLSPWRNSAALLRDFQSWMLQADFSVVLEAWVEAQQWRAALLLGDLGNSRMDTDVVLSLGELVVGKVLWPRALSLRLALEQNGSPPGSAVPMVQTLSRALKWQSALTALECSQALGVAAYDAVLLACWKLRENAAAFRLLDESQDLRSATSYLWGLSVLHEHLPQTIHAACVNAWMSMRCEDRPVSDFQSSPSNFELMTAWWSSSILGASNRQFHEFLAQEALKRMSSLSLEELSIAVQGAASTSFASSGEFFSSAQRTFTGLNLHKAEDSSVNFSFSRDGKEVLALLFACQIAGCLSIPFRDYVNENLGQVGQAMDNRLPSVKLEKVVRPLQGEETQLITTWPDRPVILKPPGWEVYGDHVGPQLVSFVRRMLPAPIHQDSAHNFGFLHRLDVPSSGLIVLAQTYAAFYDLQLQLHSGSMERDYMVLCHGLASPRQIRLRLFYQDPDASKAGGRGKLSVSEVSPVSPSLYFKNSALTLGLWRIGTGRRHQIRSHAAHLGHVTVRDRIYSSAATFYSDAELCHRNWLHRHRLSFRDAQGGACEATSDLPEDLQMSLAALGHTVSNESSFWCPIPFARPKPIGESLILELFLDASEQYPAVFSRSATGPQIHGQLEIDKSSSLSWFVSLILTLAIMAGGVWFFVACIQMGISSFTANLSDYKTGVMDFLDLIKPIFPEKVWQEIQKKATEFLNNELPTLAQQVASSLESLSFQALMFFVYLFFWIFEPLPISSPVAEVFKSYLLLKTIVCLLFASLMSALLMCLQCKIWSLFFVLTFLLNFIPEIGAIASAILTVPAILFDGHLDRQMRLENLLWLVIIGTCIKIFTGNVVEVQMYASLGGQFMRMHPVIIMALIMLFSALLGVTGMFLAVPTMAAVKYYLVSTDMPKQFRNPLLIFIEGDATAPHKNFVEQQRLIECHFMEPPAPTRQALQDEEAVELGRSS
ncbi:unnamed protein product [Durusdinium trenchii]|uniref:Pseudouridine synthase RsuA/RluA-like domain-containing protein n=1 Tax=Durusdinium trenchii TaxID=1381693 RepID=A0ABP0IXU6_9DINO